MSSLHSNIRNKGAIPKALRNSVYGYNNIPFKNVMAEDGDGSGKPVAIVFKDLKLQVF